MRNLDRFLINLAVEGADQTQSARMQEIIRILSHVVEAMADFDPEEDNFYIVSKLVMEATNALAKAEDLALDGLRGLGYEIIEKEWDR